MGVDLKLLPIESDSAEWGYSHSILSLDKDYDLWAKIEDLPGAGYPPDDFSTYLGGRTQEGESCYGKTHLDAYDKVIRCVYAGDLGKLRGGWSRRNQAAFAYCDALPPTTRIALWWC